MTGIVERLGELPFSAERAIYLSAETRLEIPTKFQRYIPQHDILTAVARHGIGGAKQLLEIPSQSRQLENSYIAGRDLYPDEGTESEWRMMIAQAIQSGILENEINPNTQIELIGALFTWMKSSKLDDLVQKTETDIADGEGKEIDYITTGLEFYDRVMGSNERNKQYGFYPGLHVVMASSGTGKSTTMMLLIEALRATKSASEIWYFSLETPRELVFARMAPIMNRTKFLPGKDKVFAGTWTTGEILELIAENPDPNRIILYDGPDVLAKGEGKRFALEDAYRDLVAIKSNCKMVFTVTQRKRTDGPMAKEDVAEAWAKVWFADSIMGLSKQGKDLATGFDKMTSTVVKNRFGPEGIKQRWLLNQETLETQILDSERIVPDGESATSGW